jgi:hypothetical protein
VTAHNRYVFAEHTLDGGTAYRCHPHGCRSILVLRGTAGVQHALGTRVCGAGEGWHAPPGGVYRIVSMGTEPAVVIEAVSACGDVTEAEPQQGTSFAYVKLSGYTVIKPWGYEIWYTWNLLEPEYALKRIHMIAGHRSSLRSHELQGGNQLRHRGRGHGPVRAGRAQRCRRADRRGPPDGHRLWARYRVVVTAG